MFFEKTKWKGTFTECTIITAFLVIRKKFLCNNLLVIFIQLIFIAKKLIIFMLRFLLLYH